MARIDTVVESNGPDRFNSNPGCSRHHAGVRTGIKDYCCCCDPCNYVRKNESASFPELRHCCRCLPKIILAKFTATNGDACCRNAIMPMVVQEGSIDGESVIFYSGSIAGHAITIYILSSAVDGYSSSDGCSWTISIPSLGVYENVAIDHTEVTCLGVPEISVTGVTAYEGCVGTISLSNYATVKVPFSNRFSYLDYTVEESITVPFPYGFTHHLCEDLPRWICVTKKHNRQNEDWTSRVRSPKIPWEIEWWRAFRWDDEFIPYLYENETPEYPIDDQWVIGRWIYTPEDETAFVQYLWLIQDYSGECYIQPDFESPANPILVSEETYSRVPLSSCGCDFKILDIRPVIDPSPPDIPGQSLSTDLLGIDYRGGACACWDYYCGKRRCVPRCLCGFLYVNGTLYKDILFTWNNTQKCWVASGGVDLDGYGMPFDLSICLDRSETGECQLSVTYEDYNITPIAIADTNTVLSGSLQGTNYAGDDFFALNFTTAFDCECKLLFTCVTATPCNTDCGSHPEVLYLTLRGWSEASDIPPPPVTGPCSTEITLVYRQSVVVTGSTVLFVCGYIGYKVVSSMRIDDILGPVTEQYLITVTLSLGQLRIDRRLLSDFDSLVDVFVESRDLDTETCDPYYGYYGVEFGLRNCFFGDTSIIWHRWEAEITE